MSENSPKPDRLRRRGRVSPGPGNAGPLVPQSSGADLDPGETNSPQGPFTEHHQHNLPHTNRSGGQFSVSVIHTEQGAGASHAQGFPGAIALLHLFFGEPSPP